MPYHALRYARAALAAAALLFAVPAIAAPEVTPSPWSVRAWQSDDGVPNNHVAGLARTPDGYLWVATYSMPARFDGVRFEAFAPKDFGIGSHQKFSAIAASAGGALWLGTIHGTVVRLDARQVTTFGDGLPSKPVLSLVETPDGALWLTHQGGALHRLQDGRLTAFGANEGLPSAETPDRYVCSLAVDVEGRLWFSKDGHVGIFRDGRFTTLRRLKPANARLAPAHAGGVWVCSEGELLRFTEDKPLERIGAFDARRSCDITALLEDPRGHVWIGTADRGVIQFDGERFESVALADPRISSLLDDAHGNVWVGTVGGGLSRIRPRAIALENAATGLPTGVVQSLAEDAAGQLWATTQSGLLLRRPTPDAAWQIMSVAPAWPGGRAATVATDPHGAVWIGTRDRALHRWKDGAFSSWGRVNGLAAREIHGLHVARNGEVWLALSSPDLVQRLRNGKLDTFPMPEGIRVIRAVAEDAAGAIWFASSKGMLVRVRDGVVTDETAATTGAPLSIRCLHATPDGGLWIGYADEGIGWWKDGVFRHVTEKHGFPENNVSQIITDGSGWLWFAGDHGIFKVRQAALEELARGRVSRAHFIRHGASDGLSSLEANFGDSPGATRTRDGRLWIPMRTALAVVTPARATEEPAAPPVLLKRVSVDDDTRAAYTHPVPLRDALDLRGENAALQLGPRHHRIAFEFAALSFTAPENIRLRYRLEGFDEDWIDAGAQRVASYSRLSAGAYRFVVQACNSDGRWPGPGAALDVVVAPFVWQTWWFRAAALVALISATVAIVRLVALRRVRARLRELEQQAALHKERTRIARDLHDEFGTRLTELGLIAELERTASPDLLGNIRALERDLDTIVWAVNPRNDTLDHLVGFVCRVTGEFLGRASIRCRFEIPDDLPARPLSPELRHHLFLVVREAVNNVTKHAGASLVKIGVTMDGDVLQWRIENDGRGFSVAEAEKGARNGLRNMRSRIEELGGTLTIDSDPATGTTVLVRVPLEPAPEAGAAAPALLPTRPRPAV